MQNTNANSASKVANMKMLEFSMCEFPATQAEHTCMTMARAGRPPLLSTVNKNLFGLSSMDTMSVKFLVAPVSSGMSLA